MERVGATADETSGGATADGAAADGTTAGEAPRDVVVAREPVELYKVLKFEGLAASGGEAKGAIDEGRVSVNGAVEMRRRRKLVDGDVIAFAGTTLRVRRAGDVPDAA